MPHTYAVAYKSSSGSRHADEKGKCSYWRTMPSNLPTEFLRMRQPNKNWPSNSCNCSFVGKKRNSMQLLQKHWLCIRRVGWNSRKTEPDMERQNAMKCRPFLKFQSVLPPAQTLRNSFKWGSCMATYRTMDWHTHIANSPVRPVWTHP